MKKKKVKQLLFDENPTISEIISNGDQKFSEYSRFH